MEQTLDQKLEALTQIYELVDDVYDGYAASFGITDPELWVLYALSRHNGDYLQTDICRRWYYSLQTIHTTIKNMEKKGLITLLCQPGNRKNKYLHLTEAGKRLAAKIADPLMQAEKAAFSALTGEEQALLLPLLQRHAQALQAEVERLRRSGVPADAADQSAPAADGGSGTP